MKYVLVVKEESQLDIRISYKWYEEKLKGLGEHFLDALDECFRDITHNPFMNQVKHHNVRYGFVHTFPFVVVYEVEENNVVVYAVFHTRKNPSVLKRRKKGNY